MQPSDCPNGAYYGNVAIRSPEDIQAFHAADVRFIQGNLSVSGALRFVAARLTGVAGMVDVSGSADVSLPSCVFVELSIQVRDSARAMITCEQVGRGIECTGDSMLALPKCIGIGKTDGVSVSLSGRSRLTAPTCFAYTGSLVVCDEAVFDAPLATRMTPMDSATLTMATSSDRRRARP